MMRLHYWLGAGVMMAAAAMADGGSPNQPFRKDVLGWAPSVYYADSVAQCPLDKAWKLMLDYESWNPTFVDAKVTPVRGKPRTEGEVVLIQKTMKDVHGKPLSAFYAETVKVVPPSHIVWYTYPKDGESRRNFVDFGLSQTSEGVRFSIYYYAQNQLSGDVLLQQRKNSEISLQDTAAAFKKHCEALE